MHKKFLVTIAVLLVVYLGSYLAIFSNREVRFVDGAYRIVGMHNAMIPDEMSFAVYKPLVRLDELTMGPSDLDIKPE